MLNWTIETKRGSFQESSLSEIIDNMIEYYVANEEDPQQITDIYAYDDGEILQQVCDAEIKRIQNKIEEGVRKWKEEKESESEGFFGIRSEYLANLI